MKRFPVMIVLCSSLFVITACASLPTSTSKIEETVKSETDRVTNKVQSTIEQAHSEADRAVQSTSERVQGTIAFQEGLQGMMFKLSSTLNAINSGDFSTAEQEFVKLQDNWNSIENTVQKNSTKVSQQIDSQINKIVNLFNQPNPTQTELARELNTLRKTLTNSFSQL